MRLAEGVYCQTTMGLRLTQRIPKKLDWRKHLGAMAAYEARLPAERRSHVGGQAALMYELPRLGVHARRNGEIEPDEVGLARFLRSAT